MATLACSRVPAYAVCMRIDTGLMYTKRVRAVRGRWRAPRTRMQQRPSMHGTRGPATASYEQDHTGKSPGLITVCCIQLAGLLLPAGTRLAGPAAP